MDNQMTLCQEMANVRSRGLQNAGDLGQEVERLADWREHVRSHPVPLAIAAAVLGYWAVPARQPRTGAHVFGGTEAVGHNGTGAVGHSSAAPPATAATEKTSSFAGISGAAMGFVGSLIGNAVRSYVSEQLHTLIQTRGSNAASSQWQTPSHRG